jgi:hypothetical protein
LRNCVRQRFADGQIHPRSVIARQTWCKRRKVGPAVLSTPFPDMHGSHGRRALPNRRVPIRLRSGQAVTRSTYAGKPAINSPRKRSTSSGFLSQ